MRPPAVLASCLLVSTIVAVPCSAQVEPPKSMVKFGIAKIDTSGECNILITDFKDEMRTREKTVTTQEAREIDGKVVAVEVPVQVTEQYIVSIPNSRKLLIPFEAIDFSSASGKKVTDLKMVKRHLANPKPVVILDRPEQKVAGLDPFFKQLLRDSTIVIHIRYDKL